MPDTSTRFAISEPSADRHDAADVPLYIRNVVAQLEAKGTIYGQGLLSARPVSTGGSPGIQGRIYYATDTSALYYDFGTGWTQIGSIAFSGYGTLASRPAASSEPDGWLYWATDTKVLYQNEAGTWTQVSASAQYTASVGDGVSTSYVINHNLGSQNVHVQVRQATTPFAQVYPDIQITDANNVTLVFDAAPSSGQYSVTVLGGSTGSPSSPSAHATTHGAGAADALAWGTIHGRGTLAARPAAASTNSGYLYMATDVKGGTVYRSNGASWDQQTPGINADNVGVSSLATFTGKNNAAMTAIVFNAVVWDDLGVLSTVNAYETIAVAGKYEIAIYALHSGASGAGSAQVQLDRYNSAGVLQETLALANSVNMNLPMNLTGVANFAATDRVVVSTQNGATGTAGSVAGRVAIIRLS